MNHVLVLEMFQQFSTKSTTPRAQPLLPNTQAQGVLLMSLWFLFGVSLLDTKMMRSRQLTSFCQLHKSDHKNTCPHKSLYIKTWFVCLISLSMT